MHAYAQAATGVGSLSGILTYIAGKGGKWIGKWLLKKLKKYLIKKYQKAKKVWGRKPEEELLLDTNTIISDGKRFVSEGRNITKSPVSDIEIRSIVNRGKIGGAPAAADKIRSVGLPGVHSRINVRAGLTPGKRGNFADGVIGGTALERGSTLVTRDKELLKAVISAGGKAIKP